MKPKRSIKATIEYYRENPRQALRGLGYRVHHRLANRVLDVRAVLAGACNASTWDEDLGDYAGGYSHWRCGKRRGHSDADERMDGAHRFNNYVWGGPGSKVEYAPIPVRGLHEYTEDADQVAPFKKITGRRHPIDTLRRARVRQLRAEGALAAYRAVR